MHSGLPRITGTRGRRLSDAKFEESDISRSRWSMSDREVIQTVFELLEHGWECAIGNNEAIMM